jgi:oligoribonuclease (3'-5' exoribonuclease)
MSDWMTATILNSGLKQRVRKSAITTYGTDKGVAYIIRNGQMVQVRESEADLRAELE